MMPFIEVVQLMPIRVLTILQRIKGLLTTDKKKSQRFMTIYRRTRHAWQLPIETGPGWTLDLHYDNP